MAGKLDLFNEFWKSTEQDERRRRLYNLQTKQARPFSLDAELTQLVGELSRKADPRTLVRYLSAARLPYPVMWIEADYAATGLEPGTLYGTPERVGWLLMQSPRNEDRWRAERVGLMPNQTTGEITAHIYPLIHLVDTGGAFVGGEDYRTRHAPADTSLHFWNEQAAFTNLAWDVNDPMAAHKLQHRGPLELYEEAARKVPLWRRNQVGLSGIYLDEMAQTRDIAFEQVIVKSMSDQAGELAFIVSALALLNEIPCRYVPFRPQGTLRAGGRLKPFMSTSIVSIEVPATRRRLKEVDKALRSAGDRASRARHEVRGHFRHVYKLPRSNPERWERAVDRQGRPCWRTWVKAHERGDASLGWVRQTYEATAARGARNQLELEGA